MNRNIRHATLGAVLAGGSLLAGSGFAMNELAQGYALGSAQETPPQNDTQATEAAQSGTQAQTPPATTTKTAHDKHHGADAKPDAKKDMKSGTADKQMSEGKCGEGKCGGAV
jgi:uncharacterized low-complexity protein